MMAVMVVMMMMMMTTEVIGPVPMCAFFFSLSFRFSFYLLSLCVCVCVCGELSLISLDYCSPPQIHPSGDYDAGMERLREQRGAQMGRRARTAFTRLGEGHEIPPEQAQQMDSRFDV
ncbi:hypothetical protein BO78DRAFT_182641 [Aspergillus sclerotiicarbonarius CBS 121057]|uniref:Uncharacterized protein n=1 Tax=Aspergillus sclerotiicarbonarius (strain CBS 121057 / IBT 28362) TaxID=1448318 RepID=A0A319FMM6_ASPSB|nr:hypothetical protein BO78DRAFT_182641 [Aspergillus sclerotiicarbonarius CBS 121057]